MDKPTDDLLATANRREGDVVFAVNLIGLTLAVIGNKSMWRMGIDGKSK